jgi:hypothetical protein
MMPAAILIVIVVISLACHFRIHSIFKACRTAALCSTIVVLALTAVWCGFSSLSQFVVFAIFIYFDSYFGSYIVSRFSLCYAWKIDHVQQPSFSLIGRNRRKSMATVPTNVEQMIRQYRNLPIGKSVGPITKALAVQSMLVGTVGVTPTQDGKIVGKICLKTGADNQGRQWVYAYTSRAEFSKAFPEGGLFAEISFPDLFGIVEKDQECGGLFLNSVSNASMPIPRELFGYVRQALSKD